MGEVSPLSATTVTPRNFGAIAIGSWNTATLTVTFSATTTLGSFKVVTQGVTGLDFQPSTASPGTCTVGRTYGSGQSCTIAVIFSPKGIGVRLGAALVYDDAATPNLIATSYLTGIGNGGLLSFSTTQKTIGTGLSYPYGLAVDAAGNVYVSDGGNDRVVEIPANGGAQITIGSGLVSPEGVALDGAGNIYIADGDNNRVVEIPAGGGSQKTFVAGLNAPTNVAVDGLGNVYISEYGNSSVVEVPMGGGAPITVGHGLYHPYGVAVDGAGDVYIADYNNNRVVKVSAGGGNQTTIGTGLNGPLNVAVDGGDNVYITDNGNARVVEVSTAGTQTTVENRYGVTGVAVDGAGNLYVSGVTQGLIESVRTQLPATVNLGSVNVGSTPATTKLSFTNIGNIPLTLRSSVTPQGYSESDLCNGSVAVNSVCTLSVTFTPPNEIPASGTTVPGTLTLTDNSLSPSQAIGLTVTELGPATAKPVFSPAGGTYTGTQMVSITDATPNATIYYTTDGTVPSRSSPIYVNPITVSSSETIKAYAVAPNYLLSPEGVATYTINTPTAITLTPTLKNFGAVAVRSSEATPLTLTFNAAVTLGSIAVMTQGVAGLDFQRSTTSPGTCKAGTTYSSGQSCTIAVTFTPMGIGVRMGAVLVYDADSTPNLLATTYLGGTGNGGLPSFSESQTTVGTGLFYPYGVAPDAAGNLYIADTNNNRIVKVPAGGGAQTTIASGFNYPWDVTVDGTGNVYVADGYNNRVVKLLPDGEQSTVGTGLNLPTGVAVDWAGNLYITDMRNSRVVKIPASGGPQTTIGSGLYYPGAVAVDIAGDVYIADTGHNQVVEVTTEGTQITVGSGFSSPAGLAVDGAGNVYVSDLGNVRLVEVFAGGSAEATIMTGLRYPNGVAVDGAGNVYICDSADSRVVKLERTQLPGTVSLGTVTVGGTPGTAQLGFTNIGNVPLSFRTSTNTSQYSESDECNGSVAVNASCTLDLSFTPTKGLPSPGQIVPGTLTLSDNSLSPSQKIGLTGVAIELTAAKPTFSPPSGTYTGVQMVTITDATPGAIIYYTTDGTVPSRSSPIYSKPITVSSSETIKAYAVAPNYLLSLEGVAVYNIKP